MVFSTIPPHQLRLSYKFTIVFIEEICLVSLLLLTVVSNTFAKFELGCLRLSVLLFCYGYISVVNVTLHETQSLSLY
jgi:hypothetical protein